MGRFQAAVTFLAWVRACVGGCFCRALERDYNPVSTTQDDYMNEEYGFRDEVVQKYGRLRGQQLYARFQHLFNRLPLCSVVDAGTCAVNENAIRTIKWSRCHGFPRLRSLPFNQWSLRVRSACLLCSLHHRRQAAAGCGYS